MIDKGANPFIVTYGGKTKVDVCNLQNLSNVPTQKSVYFTIRPFEGEFAGKTNFPDPWFYRTGVFGTFDSLIGQGASGIVVSGNWFGWDAAFKFVDIGIQKYQKSTEDALRTLSERLSEVSSIQSTAGSKIVKFYGHYR